METFERIAEGDKVGSSKIRVGLNRVFDILENLFGADGLCITRNGDRWKIGRITEPSMIDSEVTMPVVGSGGGVVSIEVDDQGDYTLQQDGTIIAHLAVYSWPSGF